MRSYQEPTCPRIFTVPMTDLTVFVVPHTHWDREWYDTAARFRQRLVPVVDEIIDLLNQDPAFNCFLLDGQAVILDDYLSVRPERRDELARLVGSGRLLAGPWYVLADELLSSDECLVRNLLTGYRTAAMLGGHVPIGYSPDAFGHPAALPAILAGFGIRYAILWRGYGGEPGQEGDVFRWQGAGHAEITVHHLPPPGYEIGSGMPGEQEPLARRWRELEAVLKPRAGPRPLLLPAGADHHAADRELPGILARLATLAPGHRFRIASPLDYFAALPDDDTLPTTRGELRFSYRYTWTLQGVHSTRSGLKRAIAEGDRLLVRWAEPQVALATMSGGPDRSALLRSAWRDHLLNHPHDTLCGCLTDEVAREAAQRAESVIIQARGLLSDALHDRLGQDRSVARRNRPRWSPGLVVVNPRPRTLRGVVETTVSVFQDDVVVGRSAPAPDSVAVPGVPVFLDDAGHAVPTQVLSDAEAYERLDSARDYPDQDRVRAFRVAVWSPAVPPLGLRHLREAGASERTAAAAPPEHAVRGTATALSGSWGMIKADAPSGYLFVPGTGLDVLAGLGLLVSERDEGDTYTFQPVDVDVPIFGRWSPARLVWEGPLVAAVSREVSVGARVRATVSARLDAGSRLLRFVVEGTNLTGNHRLRIVFAGPAGAPSSVATADMQYGPVTRESLVHERRDFPREWPVTAAPFQRYVSGGGITVFARGTSEYELLPDGSFAFTLFRAVGDLSRGDLAARPGNAAWPVSTPGAQEIGPFRAEFAVLPLEVTEDTGAAGWDDIESHADEFHAPGAGMMIRYGIDVPRSIAGPELRGAGLVFKALKPAETTGDIIVRCLNPTRQAIAGSWIWPRPVRRAMHVRLNESPIGEIPLAAGAQEIPFTVPPRGISTIAVTLNRS